MGLTSLRRCLSSLRRYDPLFRCEIYLKSLTLFCFKLVSKHFLSVFCFIGSFFSELVDSQDLQLSEELSSEKLQKPYQNMGQLFIRAADSCGYSI